MNFARLLGSLAMPSAVVLSFCSVGSASTLTQSRCVATLSGDQCSSTRVVGGCSKSMTQAGEVEIKTFGVGTFTSYPQNPTIYSTGIQSGRVQSMLTNLSFGGLVTGTAKVVNTSRGLVVAYAEIYFNDDSSGKTFTRYRCSK